MRRDGYVVLNGAQHGVCYLAKTAVRYLKGRHMSRILIAAAFMFVSTAALADKSTACAWWAVSQLGKKVPHAKIERINVGRNDQSKKPKEISNYVGTVKISVVNLRGTMMYDCWIYSDGSIDGAEDLGLSTTKITN